MFGRKQIVPGSTVLTCEHGGNRVPAKYTQLFKDNPSILKTHAAIDLGAADLFNHLKPAADFSIMNDLSRLLIEFNRSDDHRDLYSNYSKGLKGPEKQKLYEHYRSYRNKVEKFIQDKIEEENNVIHFSIHTFTPVLKEKVRKADIGLLFDPSRKMEYEICSELRKEILLRDPHLKVRFNYPYRGTSDGFTMYLRMQFVLNYAGIEIEVNQKFCQNNRLPLELKEVLRDSIDQVIG